MPFFGSSRHHEPEPIPEPEPERRHGLFGRKHEPVAPQPQPTHHNGSTSTHRSGGLFGSSRRRTSSPSPVARDSMSTSSMSSRSSVDHHSTGHRSRLSRTGGGGGSLLGRKLGHSEDIDPSIVAARERVIGAEAAEADADRALAVARSQVRDAREQMRALEDELKEEARRAKIKQHQAKDISKRGKGLGRESPPSIIITISHRHPD